MKAKTATASLPSAEEQMLEKRDSMLSLRDEFLAKVADLDASIASLDTVISMFNPNHVPLDIRRAQSGAPVLTLTAQPLLTDETKMSAAADTGREAGHESGAEQGKRKGGRKAVAEPSPVLPAKKTSKAAGKADAATSEVATAEPLKDAIADKAAAKKKLQAKAKKLSDAAREEIRGYFAEIDKLKTLADIVKSDPQGVPFKRVKEEFLAKHPLDVSRPEMRKVFSDRLSSILYSMGQQGVVEREERVGSEGKESFWVSKQGGNRSAGAQSSTEVAA